MRRRHNALFVEQRSKQLRLKLWRPLLELFIVTITVSYFTERMQTMIREADPQMIILAIRHKRMRRTRMRQLN